MTAERTSSKALLYLRYQGPEMTEADLTRLLSMQSYAHVCGYEVTAIRTVLDPWDAEAEPGAWVNARRDLREGRFDVIVLWHEDLDLPDVTTRRDLGFH